MSLKRLTLLALCPLVLCGCGTTRPTVPFPAPPPELMTPPAAFHSLKWLKLPSRTAENMTSSQTK